MKTKPFGYFHDLAVNHRAKNPGTSAEATGSGRAGERTVSERKPPEHGPAVARFPDCGANYSPETAYCKLDYLNGELRFEPAAMCWVLLEIEVVEIHSGLMLSMPVPFFWSKLRKKDSSGRFCS